MIIKPWFSFFYESIYGKIYFKSCANCLWIASNTVELSRTRIHVIECPIDKINDAFIFICNHIIISRVNKFELFVRMHAGMSNRIRKPILNGKLFGLGILRRIMHSFIQYSIMFIQKLRPIALSTWGASYLVTRINTHGSQQYEHLYFRRTMNCLIWLFLAVLLTSQRKICQYFSIIIGKKGIQWHTRLITF